MSDVAQATVNDCESAAMSSPALAFKFVEAVITPVEEAIVIAAAPSRAFIAPVSREVSALMMPACIL